MAIDWNKAYPPKFFNQENITELLAGIDVLTITAVAVENIGNPPADKVVLRFTELPQGFVLNPTNSKMLRQLLGPNTDTWSGAHIRLVLRREGIRVAAGEPEAPVPF